MRAMIMTIKALSPVKTVKSKEAPEMMKKIIYIGAVKRSMNSKVL